jgi:hypothetical protein
MDIPCYLPLARAKTRDRRISRAEFTQEVNDVGLHQLWYDNRRWLPDGRMMVLCEPGSGKGAMAHVYVDPSIDADTGTGTIGDPYGDLQFALNSRTTQVDGYQFNIKSGTAERVSAPLSRTIYGAPTNLQPLCLRGYDSVANDGGKADLDLDVGLYALWAALARIHHIDLHVFNGGGTNLGINTTGAGSVQSCEVNNVGSHGVSLAGANPVALDNYVHDCGSDGINVGGVNAVQSWNYCADNVADGMDVTSALGTTSHNICVLNTAGTGIAVGIRIRSNGSTIRNNSVLARDGVHAGVRHGIFVNANTLNNHSALNNIVEGCTSTGSSGINGNSVANYWGFVGYNAAFNNTTNYLNIGDRIYDGTPFNEVLPSSAFAKEGALSFANRFNYFKPLDVGGVLAGGYQHHGLAKGAIPRQSGSGVQIIPQRQRRYV